VRRTIVQTPFCQRHGDLSPNRHDPIDADLHDPKTRRLIIWRFAFVDARGLRFASGPDRFDPADALSRASQGTSTPTFLSGRAQAPGSIDVVDESHLPRNHRALAHTICDSFDVTMRTPRHPGSPRFEPEESDALRRVCGFDPVDMQRESAGSKVAEKRAGEPGASAADQTAAFMRRVGTDPVFAMNPFAC